MSPVDAVLIALGVVFLAELGDKSQLATLTLAATNGPVGTWIGAVIGELAADALAIGVGARLGTRLSGRAIRWASAGAFAAFGVLLLAGVG